MRNFNTTSVNLRATLDDVDPLVDASKPVAVALQPVLRGTSAPPPPTSCRRPRPRPDHQRPGPGQRPGRPDPPAAAARARPRSARSRLRPNGADRAAATAPSPRALGDGLRAQRLARRARLLPRLHARADRLVRRLRPLRRHSTRTAASAGSGRPSTPSRRRHDLPVIAARPALGPTSFDDQTSSAQPSSSNCSAAPAPTSARGATPTTARPRSPTATPQRRHAQLRPVDRSRRGHEAPLATHRSRCSPPRRRPRRRAPAPTTRTPTRSSSTTPSASSRAPRSRSPASRPARSRTSTINADKRAVVDGRAHRARSASSARTRSAAPSRSR